MSTENTGWNKVNTMSEEPSIGDRLDTIKQPAGASGGNRGMNMNTGRDNNSQAQQFTPFRNLFGRLEVQTSISEKGIEYFNRIRKDLEDTTWGHTISTTTLNEPNNAWMFTDVKHNVCMIMIINENFSTSDSDESRMSMFNAARSAARAINSTVDIMNVIVVYPEDYDKVATMSIDIKNSFLSETDPDFNRITLKSLEGTNFVVSTNRESVLSFVNQISPHGVHPDFQYGFTINMVTRVEQQKFDVSNKKEYRTQPIIAVTGRTRVLTLGSGVVRPNSSIFGMQAAPSFLPFSEITGVFTTIKRPEMMALVLAVAQQVFINNDMWQVPFMNFASKNHLDLGNLFQNEDGTLQTFNQETIVREAIMRFFHRPYLTINITEGRSRVRGLEWLASPEHNASIAGIFNDFFRPCYGQNVLDPNIDMAIKRFPEFIGTIMDEGELKDSRYIDFLRVVQRNPNDYQNALPLLSIYNNPSDRANFIKTISAQYMTRYVSSNVVFDYTTLNRLSEAITPFVAVSLDGQNNTTNTMSLDALIRNTGNITSSMSMFNNGNFGGSNGAGPASYGQFCGYGI